jgi:hypothetical protein
METRRSRRVWIVLPSRILGEGAATPWNIPKASIIWMCDETILVARIRQDACPRVWMREALV